MTETTTPAPVTLSEPTPEQERLAEEQGEKKEYKRIPDDTELVAEVLGVKLRTLPFTNDDGSNAQRYEFTFKIVEDGDYQNYRVWGETYPEFYAASSCRLYQWVQELYGQELGPGFQLNFDHLVGLKARIRVGLRTWEKKDDDGNVIKSGSKNYVKWVARLTGDEPQAAGTVAEFRAQNAGPSQSWDDEPF